MRRTIKLILLLVALTAACSSPNKEAVNAAMELYGKYRDHSESLTVAFIGNYEAGGMTFNTVLFHTEDNEEWEWVKHEFGMDDIDPAAFGVNDIPRGADIMAIPMALNIDLDALNPDQQQHYLDSVVMQLIKSTMGIDFGDDSIAMENVVIMNFDDFDELPDGSKDAFSAQFKNIIEPTEKYDDKEYLVSVDQQQHNLWIFFYSTPEEQQALMEHIFTEKKKELGE